MKEVLFIDVFDKGLAQDAIINDRHTGHKNDYLLLHVLIKRYQPKSFFEVGTNTGYGTLIIKNAIGDGKIVYSLDLPDDQAALSKQHPISEGKTAGVGHECWLPYVQLRGDSMRFNYSQHPAEGYFIDGEHTFDNVYVETCKVVRESPSLIIWHDCDVPEVLEAVEDAMNGEPYDLFRVTDTRICYAIIHGL